MIDETLTTLFISIMGAFAASYFAYRFYSPKVRADLQKEFESRFNERKWETYTEFANILYQVMESTRSDRTGREMPKIIKRLNEFISRLWIVGSDEVVEAVSEWLRYSRLPEDEKGNSLEGLVKLTAILIEMRKDLGYESSKIGPKDLLATFIKDMDNYL